MADTVHAKLARQALWRAARAYDRGRTALVPVDESIARIGAALDPKTPYTALIAPAAQHNLTIQPDPKAPFFWWHQAPGLIDTVVAWVALQTRVAQATK